MVAELAQFILALCFVLAFCQMGLARLATQNDSYHVNLERTAHLITLLLLVSFGLLVFSFVRSDFSLALVANHSHSTKPLFYKIAASWGNHEGSLLLWVLLLALYGSAFALFSKTIAPKTKSYTLMTQALLLVLFLGFLIFTSNPFQRIEEIVFQGQGLNPVLQDIALVFHPPILYVGYVGLSMAFSLSLGALLARQVDGGYTQEALKWTRIAWVALTIGIALGAWWAYRELGWGGFWFWDPVENASLMPWLVATALLHAANAARQGAPRQKNFIVNWILLLGLFAFLFSILGTFLTRSGLITSVHSFASDPTRGIILLGILFLLLTLALVLFAKNKPQLEASALKVFSRQAALLGNGVFLISATLAVLVGTIYPMVLELLNAAPIAVGAPYYEASFVPIMIMPLMIMPLAIFLGKPLRRWSFWFAPALLVSLLAGGLWQPALSFAAFGIMLAAWLALATLSAVFVLKKRSLLEAPQLLAHLGLGVLLLGAIGTSAGQGAKIHGFSKNEIIEFANYKIQFIAVSDKQAGDYRAEEAQLLVSKNGEQITQLSPQVRHYIARPQPTREADIYTSFFPPADLHAILGDEVEGKRAVQFYYNPLAPLLWLGAALMALGGLVGVIKRK